MQLEGKNVIYIGGFGGIGERCVEAFLKSGVKSLIIFDLKANEEYLEYLKNTYSMSCVDFVHVDLTERQSIETAYKEAKDKMGVFDIVVNGAGVFNERNVELTVTVNLIGLINSSLIGLGYMSKMNGGQGGCIINLSSIVGLYPSELCCIYSATKCGVTSFTRAFANPVYFNKTGISFITVCPGATVSPMGNNLATNMIMPDYDPGIVEVLANLYYQPAEDFANNLMSVIAKAKNGSTWLLKDGTNQEIQFNDVWQNAQETC